MSGIDEGRGADGETAVGFDYDLADCGVDVWVVELDREAAQVADRVGLLSADERERYERLKVEDARRRFAVTRASLRTILGRYLNVSSADLEFVYKEHGKPELAPDHNSRDIRFNLSHSHERAVLAVGAGGELGVDIERLRDSVEFVKLAKRFFSPREAESLAGLSGDELKRQFFQIWTAKESYIKAIGTGLRLPLDQFDFEIGDKIPALHETRHDPREKDRWCFRQFEIEDDYLATLAMGKPERTIRFCRES